ncbi:hypothetical protein KAFR_0J02930 [Kazachstania africana CBS 2517]|uniref:Uncharacterized protein n=1 Tax=Kazachstania africana (strain ATCC 22294 / BCRC 22015 / CBS 2517 / CECT 1963 / NBRC 1671 / NRRL Y-8276) TaxID=1071382 RepID=H2B157_KAZAF|nr:hypothetical protein KAFR_0J02930 [Kazachstania africana CBS 2517]CCF60357.1 hypothetical protein KAFR_0J02930 [Kazachstania africana CBS 2517]
MSFELWQMEGVEVSDPMGGYVDGKCIKEKLSLNRKAQKLLAKVSRQQNWQDVVVESLPVQSNNFQNFMMDVVAFSNTSSFRRRIIQYKVWYSAYEENNTLPAIELKEKVKLSKDCKDLLNIKKNLSFRLADFITDKPTIKLDSYGKFHLNDLLTKKDRGISHKVRFPLKESNLDEKLNNLLDERISKSVQFQNRNYSLVQFKLIETRSFSKFGLDLICVKRGSNVGRKFEFRHWHYNDYSDPNKNLETISESIYNNLFDINVSKLEFYKLSVGESSIKHDLPFKSRVRQSWHLDKMLLKSLDWNPFKNLKSQNVFGFLYKHDSISCVEFNIRNKKLVFPYLVSSTLDLIDLDKKKFGNLRLGITEVERSLQAGELLPETEFNDTNSSPNVTTTEQISMSLAVQKRSFIDDDLRSTLDFQRKRRKYISTRDNTSANLLASGISKRQESPKPTQIRDNHGCDTSSFKLEAPRLRVNMENRYFILNSDKLEVNYKLLQLLLSENENIQILERSLDFDCDFIMNYQTCVFRIRLSNFFQLSNGGKLYYENQLQSLLKNFKTIIILVEYSELLETVDQEVFWRLRFFLNFPQFEVHFVPTGNNIALLNWITMLVVRFAEMFDEDESFESITVEEQILCDIGLNILLVKRLLKKYDIPQILKHIIANSCDLNDYLTPSQLTRLSTLIHLNW